MQEKTFKKPGTKFKIIRIIQLTSHTVKNTNNNMQFFGQNRMWMFLINILLAVFTNYCILTNVIFIFHLLGAYVEISPFNYGF